MQAGEILWVNGRRFFLPHLVIVLLACFAAPFLMGVENLDFSQAAKILETFVGLFGIVICMPVLIPDQDPDIRELAESKKLAMWKVHCIRLAQVLIALIIVVGGFLLYLKNNGCQFPFWKFCLGTLANCLFLGGIGLLVYGISNNIAVSYMIPVMYYILNFGASSKYLGKFYLFAMAADRYEEKYYLMGAGMICLILALVYRHVRFYFK